MGCLGETAPKTKSALDANYDHKVIRKAEALTRTVDLLEASKQPTLINVQILASSPLHNAALHTRFESPTLKA